LNVLITATPFCENSLKPIKLLRANGINFTFYNKNIKTEKQLIKLLKNKHIVIAGLEKYTKKVIKKSKSLKLISRVGIGLDNVNLEEADKNNILVTHTPDGPTLAVVEFTLGLMLSCSRLIHLSNLDIRNSKWQRYTGRRLEDSVIGIIGIGRTGKRVVKLLSNIGVKKILINDIKYKNINFKKSIIKTSKKNIYKKSDIISLHVPLTKKTSNLIAKKEFRLFKKNSILINTSRGGIVNENDLYLALKNKKLFSAAMDVFSTEPYNGRLKNLKNCLLTPHMASMTKDCRIRMETEAVEEAIRLVKKKKLKNIALKNI